MRATPTAYDSKCMSAYDSKCMSNYESEWVISSSKISVSYKRNEPSECKILDETGSSGPLNGHSYDF